MVKNIPFQSSIEGMGKVTDGGCSCLAVNTLKLLNSASVFVCVDGVSSQVGMYVCMHVQERMCLWRTDVETGYLFSITCESLTEASSWLR